MAFSKAHLFPATPFHQAFWSKALAHPARVIILDYLLQHGTTPFKDLCKIIPLAKTTVSQHIRILRMQGLIEPVEILPNIHYKLEKKNCHDLALRITDLHVNFTRRSD